MNNKNKTSMNTRGTKTGRVSGVNLSSTIIYQINDTYDISVFTPSTLSRKVYTLINKKVTADDVLMGGLQHKATITDPLTIALFTQLIQSRKTNQAVAEAIQPFITARNEHDLTSLITKE
jgi:hypothetical protein